MDTGARNKKSGAFEIMARELDKCKADLAETRAELKEARSELAKSGSKPLDLSLPKTGDTGLEEEYSPELEEATLVTRTTRTWTTTPGPRPQVQPIQS